MFPVDFSMLSPTMLLLLFAPLPPSALIVIDPVVILDALLSSDMFFSFFTSVAESFSFADLDSSSTLELVAVASSASSQ
uniref:Putative secreted protein n=1 Tax=Anopheles darlingi TaxID=43151 RepID=A0A2M4D306_ANODA